MKQAQEIRKAYLKYFKKQGHSVIPRASLVPQNDPTTLFTGSGMQPLIEYLLGKDHPEGSRLADSQTCLRAEDIEEVGDNRHTTFFEMLGNWSLGDYFKEEQLPWFWDFLINEVSLDPQKIYVTCFSGDKDLDLPKDEESVNIWKKLFKDVDIDAKVVDLSQGNDAETKGMQDGRIFYYDSKKNWWSRAGVPKNMPAGEPGGPDSEVFYLFDSVDHDKSYGEHCHPNCDCGRFLEIGNSVFMEYIRTKDGKFEYLPKKNVDFGGGLERIAAAANDDPDVFKISLMWPVVQKLEEISGMKYQDHVQSMRVITDHLRAATFLGVDGVSPSNHQQGYVMRRLLRRAIRYAFNLDLDFNVCEQVVDVIIDVYKDDFKEVAEQAETVKELMIKEEKVFRQTLRQGVKMFDKQVGEKLTGAAIFKLYDTYGFPMELSIEEADNRSIAVADDWQNEFDDLMQQQKDRSRTATKGQFKGGLGGESDQHKKLHTATHLLYASLRKVLGNHVIQRGSNITEERLRFDFNHPQKMTDQEKTEVEKLVNEQISKGLAVSFQEFPTDDALKKGALGQFGDRYGDKVKVYSMGEGQDQYSFEICGGPHVDNTSELSKDSKKFKIIKEQSSSAGVRRIKAVLK